MPSYQEVMDEIRAKADILEIIAERIDIKRRGRNITALCPFHDDTHPSLSISQPKQIFKCFACGVGGDIFKFVMEFDKLEFKEAVKVLARKYGVTLPDQYSQQQTYIDPHLGVKAVNEWAGEVFHKYLYQAKKAKLAREYINSRRISGRLIKTFKLGYAPDSNLLTSLKDQLVEGKNFNQQDLMSSGLLTNNRYGRESDFFFKRVIFPIYNEKNEVLGFGGRVIDESQPKYLNSREAGWFKKREILYGFRESYQMMIKKRQVWIVEGYLDVMACYEAEIPAVAPLGTALTLEQIKKLKRYVDKINLFFDGDKAGITAALRSASDLASLEADGQVFLLKEGDPFDFIQKFSKEEIVGYLENEGVNLYDFIVREYQQHGSSPVEKKQALGELFQLVNKLHNSILKEDFIRKIEKSFNISWESVKSSFKPINRFSRNRVVRNQHRARPLTTEERTLIKKERSFILFLISHPDYVKPSCQVINPKEMVDRMTSYIYRKLIASPDALGSFNQILELFSKEQEQPIVTFITDRVLKQESVQSFLSSDSVQSTGGTDMKEDFGMNFGLRSSNVPTISEKSGEEKQLEEKALGKNEQANLVEKDFREYVVRLKRDYIRRRKNVVREQLRGLEGMEQRKLQEEIIRLDQEAESLGQFFQSI